MPIDRNITSRLLAALARSPVVFLDGARQTGKSTLARMLINDGFPARYVTLDDAIVRASAQADPDGFVGAFEDPVVIDEAQLVPDLLRSVKASVDRDRRPGRFLLTGSANVLFLPRASESLAGRMEIVTLRPFSQGEIAGRQDQLVDALFAEKLPSLDTGAVRDLPGRVVTGGYPSSVAAPTAEDRDAWFTSYIDAILMRDVRELANIDQLTALPRLLSLIAARTNALVNFAELSRSSGLPATTLKRYVALLETAFILVTVPAFSANLGRRLVRSPRMYLNDTGLVCAMLGISTERLEADRALLGRLLESFVASELLKQISWSTWRPRLMHFRTHTGREVDFVLESRPGEIVGVEVKAAATVGRGDFAGLEALAEAAGPAFKRGIVLHAGAEQVPFGPKLHAVPVSALWRTASAQAAASGS